MLADYLHAGSLGLVETLWGPGRDGGFGIREQWEPALTAHALFGADLGTTWLLYGTACLATLTLALGAFARTSAWTLVLVSAQLGAIHPHGDRGIDIALRAALVLIACSGCGKVWSAEAWWRRRRDPAWRVPAIPAWPRRLLVLQLLWIYFCAGLHKTQSPWWPAGDYEALFIILNDPHFARWEIPWLENVFFLTQAGTASTMLFELGAPLMGVALWAHRKRRRGQSLSRLQRGVLKVRVRELWLLLGVGFHVALAVTMQLGIFPYGMLALYPAFVGSRAARGEAAPLAAEPETA